MSVELYKLSAELRLWEPNKLAVELLSVESDQQQVW
jgi:hypothetical protein